MGWTNLNNLSVFPNDKNSSKDFEKTGLSELKDDGSRDIRNKTVFNLLKEGVNRGLAP